jgi:hypothetical protein
MSEKIKEKYPLHYLIFENNSNELEKLLKADKNEVSRKNIICNTICHGSNQLLQIDSFFSKSVNSIPTDEQESQKYYN